MILLSPWQKYSILARCRLVRFLLTVKQWRVDSLLEKDKCYHIISSLDRPAKKLLPKISLGRGGGFCRCRMCVGTWMLCA